ncbi:hypothetical protein [Cohnella sp. JJ-181]|uniref:hypothetical protein n=1 Tax=Cohnella rhizoplanae TaxID=2974897 RepID=UPI0022FFB865|nr:hypothetical protein [Cohnella sp. JJ-181]CAI6087202.1 hypothetical protein COHCIP112018_05388 [Cohnella sp. JJ-181]
MSELAYQFCSEINGYMAGDLVRRFEFWLRVREIPGYVIEREVMAFRETLDLLTTTAP